MKSIKSIILVVAGVLIAGAMFAFKAEEPKKEYATINYIENIKKQGIVIYFATETKTISPEAISNESILIKTLNDLAISMV